MSLRYEFFVQGIPQRHRRRMRVTVDKLWSYEDEKSRDWKETVRLQAAAHRPPTVPAGPIEVTMTFYLPRPKSLPKKVQAHLKKPDVENLLKSSLDALTGWFWVDDSQIVRLTAMKVYGVPERIGLWMQVKVISDV